MTGPPHAGPEPFHSPPSAAPSHPPIAFSPPSRRDLVSWWRQFRRNARREEAKDKIQGIFGIPLNVSIKYANVAISLTNDNGESFIYGYVPIVVAKCGVFLKEKATDVEGIFRLNGSAKRIKDLQEAFDSPERYGKGLDWAGYTVHDAANVLRRYLNQLPEPIVPLDFYEQFRQPLRTYQRQVEGAAPANEAELFDHAKAVAAYQQLIRELPPLNKQLLLYILDLLAVFASKSEQNRMTSANLSAIFQPGMLSHPQHDMSPDEYKLSQDVLIFLIENQDHFLFGMNGTAADEETVKAVESGGLAPRAPTTTQTSVRRSVSSASGGADSFRKYGSLRRNVSVSSKHSRNSSTSPGTPSSLGGIHRSNTLPSKMAPAVHQRRVAAEPTPTNTTQAAPPAKPAQSPSRPSVEANQAQRPPAHDGSDVASSGLVYVHSATHGPVPKRAGAPPTTIAETAQPPRDAPPPSVSPPPPPAVVTPTKERKLSSFFSKSPPASGEQRQPNRLRKKRSPGSVCESAESSSQSLQGAIAADPVMHGAPPEATNETGGATPRPSQAPNDEPPSQTRDTSQDSAASQNENGQSQNNDHSLKPHASRTPSMNSRSSFTDHSDVDQLDEATRIERKDNRRSWRLRSPKRSSEQVGLGVGSPPLGATNPSADRSTSSIGSWHHASRSSPSDLQQFMNDPANQPLSLDAEVSNNGSNKDLLSSAEPERRSLFGKFKAKVGLGRDGDSDRDRTRSPVNSDTEKSASNLTLSPPPSKDAGTSGSTLAEPPKSPNDESAQSPVSPLPSSGMPPAIPEEPNSPESPVAAASAEQKKEAASSAVDKTPTQPEPAPTAEPPKETN